MHKQFIRKLLELFHEVNFISWRWLFVEEISHGKCCQVSKKVACVEPLQNRLTHNRTPASEIMYFKQKISDPQTNKYLSLHDVRTVEIMEIECISTKESYNRKCFEILVQWKELLNLWLQNEVRWLQNDKYKMMIFRNRLILSVSYFDIFRCLEYYIVKKNKRKDLIFIHLLSLNHVKTLNSID